MANQNRRMPAEERKPSAWKADGRSVGKKEGGAKCPAFISVGVLEREMGFEPATLRSGRSILNRVSIRASAE